MPLESAATLGELRVIRSASPAPGELGGSSAIAV